MRLMLSLLACLFLGQLLADDKPLNLTHSTSFVAYPQDANHNTPMIFGGKLLSEMDRCAGITARRFLYASPVTKDAVTIAINNVKFYKGAEIKDLVFVTGTIVKSGDKSITINMKVEKELPDGRVLLVEGEFVFVAYDLQTKSAVSHGIKLSQKE